MPLYDYVCDQCQNKQEELVKNSEQKVMCQQCEAEMRRKVGLPNFHLKGAGWFKPSVTK